MARFVRINFSLVLKREPDFVQSFQQALTYEWVNCEPGAPTMRVANLTVFQIDRELIGVGPTHASPLSFSMLGA